MKYFTKPTMKQVLDNLKLDIFNTLHCHAIGKIESFDSSNQTAKISILYTQKGLTEQNKKIVDFPILVDCPVVILSGGKGSIRFPISVGDECVVLFNDRDIDKWFSSGSKTDLNTDRKHSFSDGIALVGVRSLVKSISDYDNERTELVHDKTILSLKDKVRLKNDAANLFTILDGVLGVLGSLTTTNCVVGAPVAISPAQAAQIATFKSQLALLMET